MDMWASMLVVKWAVRKGSTELMWAGRMVELLDWSASLLVAQLVAEKAV